MSCGESTQYTHRAHVYCIKQQSIRQLSLSSITRDHRYYVILPLSQIRKCPLSVEIVNDSAVLSKFFLTIFSVSIFSVIFRLISRSNLALINKKSLNFITLNRSFDVENFYFKKISTFCSNVLFELRRNPGLRQPLHRGIYDFYTGN